MKDRSFKQWLLEHIQSILSKPVSPAPFIIWCDPKNELKRIKELATFQELATYLGRKKESYLVSIHKW